MGKKTLWSKEVIMVYDWCVQQVSEEIDRNERGVFTVFDGSTALAVCFDLPKEETIEDLLAYRSKKK